MANDLLLPANFRHRVSNVPFFRLVLVTLWLVITGALSISVSVAGFARSANPQLAEVVAPYDAAAKGERAFGMLGTTGTLPSDRVAQELATEALFRDPTAVSAVRTLGMLADQGGQRQRAARLFAYAEKLSRRDFATQLWLIEARVAAEDAKNALVHFDRALRTSKLADGILMPILVKAVEDARLVPDISALLATNPPWRNEYLRRLRIEGQALDNTAKLAALTAHPSELTDFSTVFAGNLRFDLAEKMLERAHRSVSLAVDGFGQAGVFRPFDWELAATGPVIVNSYRDGAGAEGLEFLITSGTRNVVTQKLVALKSGRYSLFASGAIDPADAAKLAVSVSCAQPPSQIAELSYSTGKAEGEFAVPEEGCRYQWLRIIASDSQSSATVSGRVSAFRIKALSSSTKSKQQRDPK